MKTFKITFCLLIVLATALACHPLYKQWRKARDIQIAQQRAEETLKRQLMPLEEKREKAAYAQAKQLAQAQRSEAESNQRWNDMKQRSTLPDNSSSGPVNPAASSSSIRR